MERQLGQVQQEEAAVSVPAHRLLPDGVNRLQDYSGGRNRVYQHRCLVQLRVGRSDT
jgi:hypothetical protein